MSVTANPIILAHPLYSSNESDKAMQIKAITGEKIPINIETMANALYLRLKRSIWDQKAKNATPKISAKSKIIIHNGNSSNHPKTKRIRR